jgi:hypothetical protein
MLVDLPPGSHRIVIGFRRTWDRTAGGVISALATLTLLVGVWVSRRSRIGEQSI